MLIVMKRLPSAGQYYRCSVRNKSGNLALAVEAAKVRASLGEISDACEEVVGRYNAVIRTISGVYSSETNNDADFLEATKLLRSLPKRKVANLVLWWPRWVRMVTTVVLRW